MQFQDMLRCMECNPVIAAVRDDKWDAALASPADVLFYLSAELMSVAERIQQAHEAGKAIFIHLDLAEGIGKDRAGIHFLAQSGADGIISTRAQLIRLAKDQQLLTVQRFFALDSQGLDSIDEMLERSAPHMMEIMPGVIGKVLLRFSKGHIPVIAGGLLTAKSEVTQALASGAIAVSTGREELWDC